MTATDSTTSTRLSAPHTVGPLLKVTDLKTSFAVPAGEVHAVNGVSLTLERGKTLGVVGESGSGKTVLARSIMRLTRGDNVITTGSVLFEGKELIGLDKKALQELWGVELSMIFQDPMTSLNPVMKVGRQVIEHLRFHLDVPKAEARATGIELLRSVRIPEAEKRFSAYPHQLSGGMRQRVSIAIALACGPKLVFADEPTTALDVTVQHQILNLLAQQQRERFMAMILVTHDLGVVAGRADEIMVMYAGKTAEYAETKSLFANIRHPYTEALMRSIPRTTNHSHTRLAAIAGRPPDLINPPRGCAFSPRCPYAQSKCFEEVPPLVQESPDHSYACFFPVGTEAGRDALAKNLADDYPQALAVAKGALVDEDAL